MTAQAANWSATPSEEPAVTMEGDELYTKVEKNRAAHQSSGCTALFLERSRRYWMSSASGQRDSSLFERIVGEVWNWVQASQSIRWFTDGERRYGQELWKLVSVWLERRQLPAVYDIRKAWREGLEVAMEVKGSQGQLRREWVKHEHPWTILSHESEVHANHCEAHNAALRRYYSAFRRRQNL